MADIGILEKATHFEASSLIEAFKHHFETSENPRLFYAPGRVNLIGEHTDYNEGFVLPIAINYGTFVLGVARQDKTINVYSLNENEFSSLDLTLDTVIKPGHWINYIEGVARILHKEGQEIQGTDLLIASNVPIGAGLSSSAALEMASGLALLSLSGNCDIDLVRLALTGQAAEHQYVGTQCGIMDQFISALGKQDYALLLDCQSFIHKQIKINLTGYDFVICDSQIKHSLASSAYNQRVQECQQGIQSLQRALPSLKSLRDIDFQTFKEFYQHIQNEVVLKRVRHVISENQRVLNAAEYLEQGNVEALGRLMFESHQSLKDDYEVSCIELDALVTIAKGIPGIVGARMTGGGFGGCTINLVKKECLKTFKEHISNKYQALFGREPNLYIVQAQDGVREVISDGTFRANPHEKLNQAFDQATEKRNPNALISFAEDHMPKLDTGKMSSTSAQVIYDHYSPELPAIAETSCGETRLTVSRSFGIRLYYQNKELTTSLGNIPTEYPWFASDPNDPDDIATFATRHVARGSRGESPWPESQWPLVGGVRQGEQNWPNREAAFGPYQLSVSDVTSDHAIFLSLPQDQGKLLSNAYGVIPQAVFSLLSESSILMALQTENQSTLGLSWSPWFVLGFAVPVYGTMTNPSTILAFPDADDSAPLQDKMTKVWNYTTIASKPMVLINPHAKTLNEPFKKFYRDVNWSLLASKGNNYVVLTRSILRHDEQFFPFLEHGRHFIEIEHTGPRVLPGEKSCVIVQHDLLPVSHLSRGQFQTLSTEPGIFEAEVRMLLQAVIKYETEGKLMAECISSV